MKKRITAALLALVMAFSLLPLRADAAVYKEGDVIEKIGSATPQAPEYALEDENIYKWYPVDDDRDGQPDGYQIKEPFTCDAGHGIGQHLRRCWVKYGTMYKFYVGRKDSSGSGSGGQGSSQKPPYSDPSADFPAGSASFTLRNLDSSGNPLMDVEYYLIDDVNDVKGHFLTNANGEIYFGGLTLQDGTPSVQTWTLKQNPPMPEALADTHEHIKELWQVTVQRTGDSTFAVTDITFDNGADNLLDSATNTLTIENPHRYFNMMATLKPVLKTKDGTVDFARPSDLKVHVTIQKPDGETMVVDLPDGAGPQAYLKDLLAGTYKVTSIEYENAEIEGYVLGTPYVEVALPKPNEDAERPILKQDYIDLGSEYPYPDFFVYLPYEEEYSDVQIANTIQIGIVDDNLNAVKGATVALKDGEETIQEFNDENGYLLDLGDSITEKKSYSLVQTVVPEGYNKAEERYIVEVSKKLDGTPRVILKKDQSFLENVISFFSGGDGIVIDPETGSQQATFTNVRKTAQIQVSSTVTLDLADGLWADEQWQQMHKSEARNITLTWNDNGSEGAETLALADGETKTFETAVPFGVSYKVEATDAYGFAPVFTGAAEGTVSSGEISGTPVQVAVEWKYSVEPGTSQPLKILMKDTEGKALPNVLFELKMEGLEEILTYQTDANGLLQIPGAAQPCSYTLQEVETPEGYVKLRKPIEVSVTPVYLPDAESDTPALLQNLVSVPTHDAVELQADGTYLLLRKLKEVGEEVTEERSNELLINVVTESGSPVEGTQITMTCPDGSKKTYSNGDVIDMEKLGMVGTFGLVQTKSIAGHNIATESYAVTVSQKDGRYTVKAENTNQGLLDKLFGKNKIPYGPDGEWVLTFVNVRTTAKLELTCEVVVTFTSGSWHDLEFEKKYKEETEYEFLLSWDDGYKREQESATLVHGELHNFNLEIPYGVEYKIECVNEKGYFDTTFTGAKSTIIGDSQLKEQENRITARNTYIIEPDPDAEPIELHLVKVDATTKKPLEGVAFELLDVDGRKLAEYTTGSEGKIDIVDTLKIGGTYDLKETKALTGYEKPSKAYGVEVEAKYKLFKASGKPVLKQSFEASIENKAVEKQEDGSYMVKNYKAGQAPKDGSSSSSPKTGDGFRLAVWGGAMLLSMAGMTLVAADAAKKKRKVR